MNASLNSTPHGPVAIPPKQGQFQFISPFGRMRPGGSSSSGNVMVLGCFKSSGVKKIILSFPRAKENRHELDFM